MSGSHKDVEDDHGCGLATLLKYVAPERRAEVASYVGHVSRSEEYCADIDGSFVGFLDDYVHYAAMLSRKLFVHEIDWPETDRPAKKRPLTVYDVGCASALQHVIFDPRIHYVGIDIGNSPEPKFFRENCTFVRGRLAEIEKSLDVDPQTAIGIANMSLFYMGSPSDWEVFDRLFRRKFVL